MKNREIFKRILGKYSGSSHDTREIVLIWEYLFYPGNIAQAPYWRKQLLEDWKKCIKVIELVDKTKKELILAKGLRRR